MEACQRIGERCDLPAAQEMLDLLTAWRAAPTTEQRAAACHKMLGLSANQVFTIGTVNRTRQPVVTARTLANVPNEGIYNFDPSGGQ